MEGNGPSGGDPKNAGLILACTDAVAVDHVAADIMGFGRDDVATNRIAFALAGRSSLEIKTTGDVKRLSDTREIVLPGHIGAVRIQTWILKHTPGIVFRILSKLLWIRPEMTEECIQCRECIDGCPKDALTIADKTVAVDEKLCVACLRCQEVCQHGAVRLKLSFLARIIWG
jgi:ferredoxin